MAIADKIIKETRIKFIVICPKSIINTAWIADANDFFPNMKIFPVKANMKKTDLRNYAEKYMGDRYATTTVADLFDCVDVLVMNPEQFKRYCHGGIPADYKGLIIDESTMIKSRTSQITKDITDFSDKCKYVYILSGKPAPNSSMDYFTQIKIINPHLFGKGFTKFRDNFFFATDFMGYNWEMKAEKVELFSELLSLVSIFIPKEMCLDLPKKTYLIRNVNLKEKTMSAYNTMEKEQLLILRDTAIAAPNKLASLMKLRQISSGFIMDTENSSVIDMDKSKINELESVLEELGDKKAIIWVNFREEIRAIEELMVSKGYTYVTAYQGTKDVDDSINKFKSNEAQFIIAHPKTLKYGVTFTGPSMKENCTYAIYYSLSFSYEDYYQSHDRIYRKGQTEPCTFIFLLSEDTIDYTIYSCLQTKGERASLIEDLTRRLTSGKGNSSKGNN